MDILIPSIVFGITLIIDLLIYSFLPASVKGARMASLVSIMLITFSLASILLTSFSIYTAIFALINSFRAVNSARVYANRLHPKAIIRKFNTTAKWLDLSAIFALILLTTKPSLPQLSILLWFSTVGSIILFTNTALSIIKGHKQSIAPQLNKKLPTVSLCLPARNETTDLPACIESLLSSTYPKLEILVLDDCSHDKTPELIKKYAKEGVRFIEGEEPNDDWLAKNGAMNKLFDESTGEIVVFVGVDVRFRTDTVYKITQQFNKGLEMISVLPMRHGSNEFSVFIQPLRYWWELVAPRLLGGRPPVLSTCWAINRKQLNKLGDFESVKRSVQPEAHFATRLKSAYKFIISGKRMGVSSNKKPREQYNTALRIRYPQIGSSPEKLLLILLIEFTVFLTPIVGIIYALVNDKNEYLLLSLVSLSLLTVVNLIISMLVVSKIWLLGLISLPYLLVEEWYLLIKSMFAYEFGIVRWKDRNICLPVLTAEKSLPTK